MNREDIIRMAREADILVRNYYDEPGATLQELERFAELIAAEEREQCDALRVEMERYRTAITLCINYANGRESEWGQRAMDAFGILEAALAAGEVSDENRI